MLRFLFVLLTFAFLPLSANAISTASIISTNCSGNLTTSLLDGASFACAGNLTLDGGFVTSDSLINISADGDLFVDNLTLTAPNITFSNSTGLLTIGSSVVINTSTAVVQSKPESTLTWNKLNIANGSGAVLSIGAGGDLKVGTGIGYVLTANNIPVVGGSIFLNSDATATTTNVVTSAGTGLLPKNFVMISDAINKEKLSLKDKSFLDSYFIKNAKDYTTYVSTSTSRGRDNPFAPYDFTRSSR